VTKPSALFLVRTSGHTPRVRSAHAVSIDANKTAADQELSLLTSDRLIYADALEKSRKAQEAFDKVAGKKRSFFDILGDQASKATELSNGIESLISMGLDDPALLQSILSSGADTGLEIIKGILAGGKASVDKLVGLSKTINDAADRIAKLTADKWYKSGIDQAQKIVDGVNSVIANTEFLLKFALDPGTAQLIGEQLDAQLGNIFNGGSPMANGGALPTPADLFGPILGSINAGAGNQYGGRVSAASVDTSNVTINVNGGDPNAVVNALRSYMRTNGSIPIRVSNIY